MSSYSSSSSALRRQLQLAVEDLLQRHIGFSDSLLVEYLIDICGTPHQQQQQPLLRQLKESSALDDLLPSEEQRQNFATQLSQAVRRITQLENAAAPASDDSSVLRAIREQEQRKSYRMLHYEFGEENDSGDVDQHEQRNKKLSESKELIGSSKSKKRIRKNAEDGNQIDIVSEDCYDTNTGLKHAAPSQSIDDPTHNFSDEYSSEFAEKDDEEKDQIELKKFTKRLLDKEKGNTKFLSASSSSQNNDRKTIRETHDESEDLDNARSVKIDELREKSRREYLKKRQRDKAQDLEEELRDERELFMPYSNLSKQEIKRINIKKKVLDIANDYKISSSDQKINRYFVPDDSKKLVDTFGANLGKTRDVNDHHNFESISEQKNWEDEHVAKASMRTGAQDIQSDNNMNSEGNKKYKMLIGDEVEFIESLKMPGNVEPEDVKLSDDSRLTNQVDDKKQVLISIEETRKSLPIYEYREQLLEAIRDHQILVIEGETGSGKTTQIAQYLYESGYCQDGMRIGITQPRRVAAMSVAARVSKEMNVKLGHEVGYCIRFEDCTCERTVLRFMTDGMLLREFLVEPDLKSYSVVIIDEAHERSISTDILFGLVKDLARYREDLKIIIASATLDTEKFSEFFDDAPIFKVPGRRYPVDIFYTAAPEADYVESTIVTVLQIHLTQPDGDILAFLSGQDEIEHCVESLKDRCKKLGTQIKPLRILPLFSSLPSDMQDKIFAPTPPNMRKVVISTNIAETSLTIEGIKYVIDSGFCKQKSFDARARLELLTVVPLSKASADQRAGRGGRTAPGKCFRLFTAWAYHNELDDVQVPEIQRTNLANVLLMLKSLGIDDLLSFDFMDPPPHQAMIYALEQLYALGALNHHGQLTKLGRQMAEFPCDPAMSKAIITAASDEYNCVHDVLTICAMLSVTHSIFYRPSTKEKQIHADTMHKSLSHELGDHMMLWRIYEEWKESGYSTSWCYDHYIQYMALKSARDIRDQLLSLAERTECVAPAETRPDNDDDANLLDHDRSQ
ncbi:MAG: putative pre-mRNA-splicing factor ATP-dependent RNA helicase dhx16, variant 2 [Marteilia pararefringens]